MMTPNVVSSPKTDSFKLRVNPDVRESLENIYAKAGLTLTDAINVFFQQSLNAGGLPFSVTDDNAAMMKAKALARLVKELELGKNDPTTYSEDEMYSYFGIER